jgi:hypothetical protein
LPKDIGETGFDCADFDEYSETEARSLPFQSQESITILKVTHHHSAQDSCTPLSREITVNSNFSRMSSNKGNYSVHTFSQHADVSNHPHHHSALQKQFSLSLTPN